VLAARVAALEDGAALTIGAAVALVLFVLHLLYQQCRSAHGGALALAGPTEPGHREGAVCDRAGLKRNWLSQF
jgi:hypothetical protein